MTITAFPNENILPLEHKVVSSQELCEETGLFCGEEECAYWPYLQNAYTRHVQHET